MEMTARDVILSQQPIIQRWRCATGCPHSLHYKEGLGLVHDDGAAIPVAPATYSDKWFWEKLVEIHEPRVLIF